MNKSRFIVFATILTSVFLYGCGRPRTPMAEIKTSLRGVPTYSVILEDMQEKGNFFKSYYHKYRIIMGDMKTAQTDWQEVPKDYFRQYLPFLGMAIWVKKDGKEGGTIGPPGYEHVGDSRYGQWRSGSSGSFWVFYGQYRLLSDLLGPRTIYRNDHYNYNRHRSQRRPYYGPNKEYGTNGSMTKRQKPNFYSRRMSRNLARQSSFSDRVNKRIGRTRTTARGRGRFGGK